MHHILPETINGLLDERTVGRWKIGGSREGRVVFLIQWRSSDGSTHLLCVIPDATCISYCTEG